MDPSPSIDATALWHECAATIRAQVSDAVWQSTFNTVRVGHTDGTSLQLLVPSALVKQRIEDRYSQLVRAALTEVADHDVDLVIDVERQPSEPSLLDALLDEAPQPGEASHQSQSADPSDLDLRSSGPAPSTSSSSSAPGMLLNPRYTFETFVTGTSNRFAQAAALSVAETPSRSYNPLFIYGDAGLGKTHLLQAIKHYVEENYPDYVVRYVTSETFLNEFIESIRLNTSAEFKRRYREVDVLLVDDIQFLENRKETQEEFFHTFNALHEGRRQLVLSSDRPPDAISTLENRLRSRFKMGLITDIQPPDLETRLAILRKKAEDEPVPVPDEILEFIATNITDNIRELEGALNRVSALANLVKEPLTLPEAEKHLHDILGDRQPRPITPALILEATAEMFDFTVEDLKGKSRRRPLVTARQIAMYVFRELTDLSYPAIAREFGGRDHTTVIHAVDKIKALMKERRQIYDQVSELVQQIRKGG